MKLCDICIERGVRPREATHYRTPIHYCEYHYWIKKGRNRHDITMSMLKTFQHFHPQIVRKWCEKDQDLKEALVTTQRKLLKPRVTKINTAFVVKGIGLVWCLNERRPSP